MTEVDIDEPLMCGTFFQLQMPHKMVLAVSNNQEVTALEKSFHKNTEWPHDQIFKIGFCDEDHEEDKTEFIHIIRTHFSFSKLNFEFNVSLSEAVIRVTFAEEMNKSIIGKDALSIPKDQPTLWINGTSDVGAVLHQFCHALGMTHEMDPIQTEMIVREPEMRRFMHVTYGYNPIEIRDGILPTFKQTLSNVPLEYDPDSIMNYAFTAYSNTLNKTVPYKPRLSGSDRLWLQNAFSYVKYDGLSFGTVKNTQNPTLERHTQPIVIFLFVLVPVLVIILITFIILTVKWPQYCK